MPTPSGQISLDDVNTELGNPAGSQLNMGNADVRALAGVPSGAISMSDLQNKALTSYEFLLISGGGSGAGDMAGGGGAGGVVQSNTSSAGGEAFTVTIGAGGAGNSSRG